MTHARDCNILFTLGISLPGRASASYDSRRLACQHHSSRAGGFHYDGYHLPQSALFQIATDT